MAAADAPPPPSDPVTPKAARWSTDRIVSLSAMAVGVCSLVITLYQTYLTREAARASVLPYLTFGVMSNDEGAYLTLRNDGLGPARLEAVQIHYKGKSAALDPYDFYLAQHAGKGSDGLSVDRVTPGRLLPAGTTVQMLGVGGGDRRIPMLGEMLRMFAIADAPPAWLAALKATGGDKAVIDVVYASVYGERWRVRSDQLVPQPQ
jgi:hypothetical protein